MWCEAVPRALQLLGKRGRGESVRLDMAAVGLFSALQPCDGRSSFPMVS